MVGKYWMSLFLVMSHHVATGVESFICTLKTLQLIADNLSVWQCSLALHAWQSAHVMSIEPKFQEVMSYNTDKLSQKCSGFILPLILSFFFVATSFHCLYCFFSFSKKGFTETFYCCQFCQTQSHTGSHHPQVSRLDHFQHASQNSPRFYSPSSPKDTCTCQVTVPGTLTAQYQNLYLSRKILQRKTSNRIEGWMDRRTSRDEVSWQNYSEWQVSTQARL